jgi:fructan beta-fructosidase
MRSIIFKYILYSIVISCHLELFAQETIAEKHRPVYHFTPAQNWMNDPNGMIYFNGTYHLFYQYHPFSSVWGPMHWGHATSKDLIQWKHQPIALYPDKNGTIFSGSAVYDMQNTSGLGINGKGPLVAVFTYHNDSLAKTGSKVFQTQGIAYSNDEGMTWTKFERNPVLKNPGINDFRDPKVFWHEASAKWIMTLAVFDRIHIYGSKNLIDWEKLSEFGIGYGVPNILWECPDLFPLKYKNKTIWVLISNINPGGPNKGSATQYFIGDFDGKSFLPFDHDIRWADFGPDEYAGITWSNTGERKIFTGWMSNWMYAQQVPTEKWRSALTMARELTLKEVNGKYYLASLPVGELDKYKGRLINEIQNKRVFNGTAIIEADDVPNDDFSIVLSNENGESVVIGYSKSAGHFYIDRTKSGNTQFHKEFAQVSKAVRISNSSTINFKLVIDVASIELFADDGLTVMTSIYFPSIPFNTITMNGKLLKTKFFELKSIIK